ncbi:MAG: hypothetical protein WAM97_10050 [Acidimicrobiales bacterium]
MAAASEKLPRLITIMGSGETAPTMVKVHRAIKEVLGGAGDEDDDGVTGLTGATGDAADTSWVTGVLLDTPYGFQMNADDLSARAVTYFRDSVGMKMVPAGFRSKDDLEGTNGAVLTARMAEAPLLFSGPGSPSYALRQWAGSLVPGLLSEKLALGGAVTFASAAALTLGLLTVPVYEIYKVGESPFWLDGLDLLTGLGIPCVVIPHYDNAEGGNHDTRFCYLGEKRLELLERDIPDGVFVLGVDEHTAITFDLDSGEATISGRGHITIRVKGRSAIVQTGALQTDGGGTVRVDSAQVVPTVVLLDLAAQLASGVEGVAIASGQGSSPGDAGAGDVGAGPAGAGPAGAGQAGVGPAEAGDSGSGSPNESGTGGTPLLEAIRTHEAAFRSAKAAGDPAGMVSAALALNDELWAWVADPNQSDELDRGRAALRAMVVELGHLADEGTRDPAMVFGPFVDLLVKNRNLARDERRFAEADSIRDQLTTLGIEVRDSPEGSTWERIAGTPSN